MAALLRRQTALHTRLRLPEQEGNEKKGRGGGVELGGARLAAWVTAMSCLRTPLLPT